MKSPWIVFFDLDGTLWDHLDITACSLPFTRLSDSVISDTKGTRITLLDGAVNFIEWVRNSGGIISTCSWNEYDKAIAGLEAFGLVRLFDFLKISTSPSKYKLIEDVISDLESEGKAISPDMLFYVDDRDIHIRDVKERFPEITFFRMWKNGMDFETVRAVISSKISSTR